MNHGGRRNGSGRKSKAVELGLPALIDEVTGPDGKKDVIKKLFEKAKEGSFLHAQLFLAYSFGKPTEDIDITSNGKDINSKEIIYRDYAKPGV